MIECKLCGLKGDYLVTHLKFKHSLSTKDYRGQFPGASVMSESRKNKNRDSSISPASIEFWLKKTGGDMVEAKRLLDDNARKRGKSLVGKSPSSLVWWLKECDGNEEEAKLRHKDFNNNTSLESFKKRYGEEEGLKKYGAYTEALKDRSVFSYKKWADTFGDSESTREMYKESKSRSLKSSISRYGEEEGSRRYYDWVGSIKDSSKRSLTYWINNTASEKEAREHLADYQRRDISWFKDTFGSEWEEKRSDWIAKATKNWRNFSNGGISKQQNDMINDFIEGNSLGIMQCDVHPEYEIISEGKTSFIDFLLEVNGVKIAIEYNGDYWHCNPMRYEAGSKINIMGSLIPVDDIWEKDRLRLERIRKIFPVVVIWESDFLAKRHVSVLEGLIKKVVYESKESSNK